MEVGIEYKLPYGRTKNLNEGLRNHPDAEILESQSRVIIHRVKHCI